MNRSDFVGDRLCFAELHRLTLVCANAAGSYRNAAETHVAVARRAEACADHAASAAAAYAEASRLACGDAAERSRAADYAAAGQRHAADYAAACAR